MARKSRAGSAAEDSAALTRCALVAGLAAALLAWPGNRADAARLHGTAAQSAKEAVEKSRPAPKGPLQIIISIADQKISVYSGDVLIARSEVSTGVPDHPTPTGVFTVIQKQRWHRSNLYSAAPMPFMQRITWSGVALHAGVLPGHPASHGCIRLTEEFAVRLWHLTKLSNRVIIARDEVVPVEISHPQLFAQRKPDAVAIVAPAEARKTAQAMIAPEADFIRPVNAVGIVGEASGPSAPAATERTPGPETGSVEPKPPAKVAPISVFISRKQGKLLVRQDNAPLFESDVTIRDPERPIGTHVFTAIERKDNGTMRWTVVSFPDETARRSEPVREEPAKHRGREREAKRAKPAKPAMPLRPSPARANAALERIDIPPEAGDRISELLSPKSSLIVSDQPLSDETDTDTDFIVLVR
jgi:hypothetical protein